MGKGAPTQAFTITSNGGRLRDLKTNCDISAAFDPNAHPSSHLTYKGPFVAVWDTGAMASVVSQRVVTALKLKPIGITVVHGVHGSQQVERMLVNIRLPNQVQFHSLEVTTGDLAGCDALIGMDIITIGDFAVTNRDGRTVFSFRTPSSGCIDYVKLIGHTNAELSSRGKLPRGKR